MNKTRATTEAGGEGLPATGRATLIGLAREELVAAVAAAGERPYRARQIWQWVYDRGAASFAEMTTLSKESRERLDRRFTLARPGIAREQTSADGTRKWLVRFADGAEAETVYIPEEDRGTLCLSSQVGCTLACRFCHTGTQRLVRNLTAGEIVGQVLLARDALGDWPSAKEGRKVTNLVLMGMGEPLYNYDHVATALRICTDGDGIAISRRRITVSTAGVAPMIRRVGEELGVKLALSLHAVTDELRDRLVPLNRKYPIATLLAACRAYPGAKNARRITFEYVMLRGVNDAPADARALARLVAGIPAKVNLLPFNPWPGAPFEGSDEETIRRFAEILRQARVTATVRTPRGRDIAAACGQLKSATERRRRERTAAGEGCKDGTPPPPRGA